MQPSTARQQRLEAYLAQVQPGLPRSLVATLVQRYLDLDHALREAHQTERAQATTSRAGGGGLIDVDSYIDASRMTNSLKIKTLEFS
jgi:hypothetical protein